MLFYTFRNDANTVEATYSGRFAFVHFPHHDELQKIHSLRAGNDLQGLWSHTTSSDRLTCIVAHEYTHKHIFAQSPTGMLLNGWRFWARARFLVEGSTHELEKYYRARAIYFHTTYSYHEKIAEELDQEMNSSSQSISSALKKIIQARYADTIHESENHITQKWEDLKVAPSKIPSRIYTRLGKSFQNSFSLMHSYKNDDGHHLDGGISDSGIANDVGTIRSDDNWTTKSQKFLLSHLIVLPLNRCESFEKYFDWYWLGQRAQYQTLQQETGISFEEFSTNYIHPLISFIFEWSGVPFSLHAQLIELVEDTFLLEKNPFLDRWDTFLQANQDNPRFVRFFCFFYLHGN